MRPTAPKSLFQIVRPSDALMALFTAGFIALSLLGLGNNSPELFKLRFNPYAILSGLSTLVLTVLLVALVVRRGYIQARIWFTIEVIGGIFSCLGEVLIRLSTTPEQVIFWAHISAIGLAIIPIGFFMFTYYFINGVSRSSDILAPIILAAGGGILLLITNIDPSTEFIEATRGFWGYSIPLTLPFILLVLWVGSIIAICIVKLVAFKRIAKTDAQKHQTELIIFGATATVVGGIAFDVIPRALGWHILPVGILMQLFLPVTIMYAIYRYDAFAFEISTNGNDILDTLSEAVIVTDKKFKIVTINQYGLTLTGYEHPALLGRPLNRLFEPAKFRSLSHTLLHAPKNQPTTKFPDVDIIDSLGVKKSVNVTISEIRGGEPAYVFVLTNISELKEYYESEQERNSQLEARNNAYGDQQRAIMNLLEDSRDLGEQLRREKADVEQKVEQRTEEVRAERIRLEASINSLNIGFLIIDNAKNTISANAALRNILYGVEATGEITVSDLEKKLKSDFNLKKSIDACLSKGKTISQDSLQYNTRVLRLFIAPVFGSDDKSNSLGAVILVEDISESKAVERSRDEFFSIASHELRTPLTAIRGNTKMIMDYYSDQLKDPMLAEMVDDIHDSSIRLITIVNDFLDTSRLEQGKITFVITSFDLDDLVKEIAQEFKAGDMNPNLYVKIDSPVHLPNVLADRDRLKQTIINMIGNAFKFTEKGGVTITLRADTSKMTIDVADTGKGIPVESQNLLFRKFQQASNNILTRDSTRSTGLGLYISKLLMEGMKGKIYLKSSKVNKGSVFTLEVPIFTAPKATKK